MKHQYEVIVGNVGSVYSGTSKQEAERKYREYVEDSRDNYGRAAGENVTLMKDGEVFEEFVGEIAQIEFYTQGWEGVCLAEWIGKLEQEPLSLRMRVFERLANRPEIQALVKMAEERRKECPK